VRDAGASPSLDVLVAGDLCVRPGTLDACTAASIPWQDLADFIAGHDIALVNLECPLADGAQQIAKYGPSLTGDSGLAAAVRDGGFTGVTLANNHILDGGAQGLLDTLAACRAADLATVGAGVDLASASAPLIREVRGVRLAIVNVAEREFSIATTAAPGAAPLDAWSTLPLVHELAAEGDAVLVIVHGGNEYYPLPRPGLRAACRSLVRAGACAVVCHHAHVSGPWEVVDGAPIVYGLGNFLFPPRSRQPDPWHRGYAVSLRFTAAGATSLRLIPYEQGRTGASVSSLTETDAAAFLGCLDRLAAVVSDDDRLGVAWRVFCRRRGPDVIAAALGLTRVERRLLRAGVWPSWRLPRCRLAGALDMVVCDSHREVLENFLGEELKP
jgi:poly-gamma-glutamate synthesis protein (capsule biosynthesis protein)